MCVSPAMFCTFNLFSLLAEHVNEKSGKGKEKERGMEWNKGKREVFSQTHPKLKSQLGIGVYTMNKDFPFSFKALCFSLFQGFLSIYFIYKESKAFFPSPKVI